MPEIQPITPADGGPAIVSDPTRPAVVKPSVSPSTGDVKLPEFLTGKMTQEEFVGLPETARTVLVERARMVQEDYRDKTTKLAEQRKVLEPLLAIKGLMDADPKLAAHLDKSLEDYKAGKVTKQDLKDDWDTLRAESDSEGLRVLDAIEKRFGSSGIATELKELKQMVSQLVTGNQTSRRSQLEVEIGKLPESFKTLATEHQDKLLRLGMTPTFAQDSARDLLMRVAPRAAYEEAFLKSKTAESQVETERVRELAGFPSVAGAPETPVLADGDVIKSADPRYGNKIRFSNLIERVLGEAKRHLPTGG